MKHHNQMGIINTSFSHNPSPAPSCTLDETIKLCSCTSDANLGHAHTFRWLSHSVSLGQSHKMYSTVFACICFFFVNETTWLVETSAEMRKLEAYLGCRAICQGIGPEFLGNPGDFCRKLFVTLIDPCNIWQFVAWVTWITNHQTKNIVIRYLWLETSVVIAGLLQGGCIFNKELGPSELQHHLMTRRYRTGQACKAHLAVSDSPILLSHWSFLESAMICRGLCNSGVWGNIELDLHT